MDARDEGWGIELRKVEFRYPQGEFVLGIERWDVAAGEQVAVIGPSGSGKTTLLHLVAGIFVPQRGEVRVGPTAVHALSDAARRQFRIRHVGFVFQEFELFDYLSVAENIVLPFLIHPVLRLERKTWETARELAGSVGLADKLQRNVTQLSQGERQRVGICRALVAEPRVILADEPTGNLDPRAKHDTVELLRERARVQQATLVMVTHDRQLLEGMDAVFDFAHLAAHIASPKEPA